jgi:hypothetical protein
LLTRLNELGGKHGIGRPISSRTAYRHEIARRLRDSRRHDPLGGAYRGIEQLCLDRSLMHQKDN